MIHRKRKMDCLRPPRSPISSLIWALSALWLFGCAGLKSYEPPRASVSNMVIQEAKALETAFLVELRVFNTNDVPLTVKGIDCSLNINGKPFAAGVARVEKTIPAYGTDIIPVVVYASVLDAVNRVIGMIQDVHASQKIENISYTMRGKLRIGGVSAASLPFSAKGELNLFPLNPGSSMKATP